MNRFRGCRSQWGEVVLPDNVPSAWLNLRAMESDVSFVDLRFDESATSGRLSPHWRCIQRVDTKATNATDYLHHYGSLSSLQRVPSAIVRARAQPQDWRRISSG